MNKVFDLYRYLKLSGFSRELEILKTALETTPEELEEAFPQLFRFYEEGKPTAMFGGVFAQINKYIEEGYINQQEIDAVQTFDSLKQKMKELKSIKKETEAKFKYLNEYDVEQEFKDMAKEKALSKEDFEFAYKSFIAEDEDNHELEQAIAEIADLREKYRLLKEKINTIEDNEDLLSRLADPLNYKTLDNANTEINNLMMDVNNIIEGRQAGGLKKKLLNYYDYIYNGENKLNADYPAERKGKAKKTSKVLYSDGNWAIVNSKSEESCQYWERGAVVIEGDRIQFNTCTSRIDGVHGLTSKNLYDAYSEYTVIQILKLENGQPKFYEGPNDMFTLCFRYSKDIGFDLIPGSASVNADNADISEDYLKEYLPQEIHEELMTQLTGEHKYFLLSFDQLLDADVPKNLEFELFKKSVSNLKSLEFFRVKDRIPDSVFRAFLEEKLTHLNAYDFFNQLQNNEEYLEDINKKTLDILIKFNAESLETKHFASFRRYYEDIFSEKIESKLAEIDKLEDFLGLGNNNIENELLEKYLYKNMSLFINNFSRKTENYLIGLDWYAGYFDTEKYLKHFSKAYLDKVERQFLETRLGVDNWYTKFRLYDNLSFLDKDIQKTYLQSKRKENLKYISNYYLLGYLKGGYDDVYLNLGSKPDVRDAVISKIESNPKSIFETDYSKYKESDKDLLDYVESKKYDVLDSLSIEEYFSQLDKINTFFEKDDEVLNAKSNDLIFSNKNSKKLLTRMEKYIMRKMLDAAKEIFKAHKVLRKAFPDERLTAIIKQFSYGTPKFIKDILSIAKLLSHQEKIKVLNSLREELFEISLEEENDHTSLFPIFIKTLYKELADSKISKESRTKKLSTILKKYS